MTPDKPTHLVIMRAADADPEGASAEVKLGHVGEPAPADLEEYAQRVATLYQRSFTAMPDRVAVVVLPYVAAIDDDEADSIEPRTKSFYESLAVPVEREDFDPLGPGPFADHPDL